MNIDDKILLLKIKNLILTKRFVIATSERDVAQFGSWSCDYPSEVYRIDSDIEKLHEQMQLQTR
jgi:hypothetical protein